MPHSPKQFTGTSQEPFTIYSNILILLILFDYLQVVEAGGQAWLFKVFNEVDTLLYPVSI